MRKMTGLLLLALAGCSGHSYFTNDMASQLNVLELKGVQFFTSSKIVLHREWAGAGKTITPRGAIIIEGGRQIEEVVIKKHSQGVYIPREGLFCVSFEPPVDGVESYLVFDWIKGDSRLRLMRAKQKYGDGDFEVIEGIGKAFLEVDASRMDTVNKDQRTAPGRSVGN